ncbi:MAG: hypothetical protein HY762_01690, partial [Planctomycetes bacterium]|nr:hypothetical protein [Planctomycetota bacterium]
LMNYLAKQVVLGWGKLRRSLLLSFKADYTRELLSQRQGECKRCGACCRLLFHCPALEYRHENNGTAPTEGNHHPVYSEQSEPVACCWVYDQRSTVCRTFPLEEKDLKDRDFVIPDRKCGYFFNGKHPAQKH